MATNPPYDLKAIAAKINATAISYRMAGFQDIRAQLKGHRRAAREIFVARAGTFNPTWAYHYGGRTEMQFNIGLEERDGKWWFRYGVAFSLEPSRSLPDPAVLLSHILRYNDYMRENETRFAAMCLWYYGDGPSRDIQDKIITENVLAQGHFFFIGHRTRADAIDTDQVLRAFDQLLDAYVYVEGHSYLSATPAITPGKFVLVPRTPPSPVKTTLAWASRHIDVEQRHRELEQLLFECLCADHGKAAVFAEQDTGNGTKIDIAVKKSAGLWLYEIKTSTCIRTCIREGLSQLMEYAFWSQGLIAARLIIVGEAQTDAGAIHYLETLRKRFGLPVYYSRLDYARKTLGSEE